MFSSWLRRLFRNHNTSTRRPPRPWSRQRLPLRLEVLEDRTLLNAQSVYEAAVRDFAGPDLARQNGTMRDVGWDLTYLYHEFRDYQAAPSAPVFVASNSLLQTDGGQVAVEVAARGDMDTARASLETLGMQVTAVAGRLLDGTLPIDALDELAALPTVQFASPAYKPYRAIGATTSQGDKAQITDLERRFLSFNGAGQTVGVLSDSFDTGPGSYAADIASGDLPGVGNPNGFTTPVNVVQDSGGGTDEGRAMLQIVHDVAPGANLAFATANGGQANFANNISRLRTVAGSTAIVDDIIYFAEPMFQDGVIAQAVDASVAAGVPYFSSAGNQARKSYESVWRTGVVRASGSIPVSGTQAPPSFFGGTTFDFDPGAGVDDMQSFTLPANGSILLSFQWDSPFFSVSGGAGSTNDLDIYVLNAAGTQVVGGAATDNVGGDAVELFQFVNTTGATATFNLMLATFAGANPGFLKYVNFSSTMGSLQFATNSGTSYGHANAAGAEAVGAAFYGSTPPFGVSPPQLESFSSAGGTAIRFDTAGNPIGPVTRQTPDITAPDGVNTTFFGGDSDGDGFPNFFGTSAAAPHAAAFAALMRQARPAATVAQIYTALESTATDMGALGFDFDNGFGLVRGPNAVFGLGGTFTVTLTAGAAANNGTADTFRVVKNGSNIDFSVNNSVVFSGPSANIGQVVVNGSNDSDLLIVDFGGGALTPTITYSGGGGAGFDTLEVRNGSFTTVRENFTNANDGSLNLDGAVVNYTGLEPVLLNVGTATNIIFNLPAAAGDDAIVEDDGTAGNNISQVRSLNGGFETTTFTNPTGSLTINTAGGDTVRLAQPDSGFNPTSGVTFQGDAAADSFFIDDNGTAAGGTVDFVTYTVTVNGGGGATNTLLLEDSSDTTADTVTVTATQIGATAGNSYFGTGGSLTYGGLSTLTLNAGSGGNTINVTGTVTNVTINAGVGSDSIALADGAKLTSSSVNGGAGTDTLNLSAYSTALTWNLTGNNAGNITGVVNAFTNVENLTGGTNTDNFVFSDGFGVTGTINGAAGTDTLDYSTYTTAVSVNLQTGAATGTGGFANIESLMGGSASDTLTGANVANSWSITANNTGNINSTFAFTSIENLVGGTSTDDFVFGNGFGVTGTLNGDGGTDTLDYTAYTTAISVNLQTGAATGTGAFSNIESVKGGSASDTLTGANTANTWNITGNNAGNINSTFSFMSIENLVGGTNSDDFVFGNGFGVTGTINGAAATDTLDYTAYTTAVTVNLLTGTATGTGGFSNIEAMTGGSGSDTLVGTNVANTWNITGTNAGNLNGTFSFLAVENLTGGTNTDNFVFFDAAGVSGTLAGGTGIDTLDYTAYTTAISVNLQTGAATGTGGFTSIEALKGGTASDTLVGANGANTWNITGNNAGNVNGTVTFMAVENLTGGTSTDNFVFSDSFGVTGTINGASGTDTLDYSAYTTAVSVNLQTGAATGTGGFANIEVLTGGNASDTLTGANVANTWNITANNAGNINSAFTLTSVENLVGGTSTDDFVFGNGIGVTGTLNGSGGTDSLDYTAYTTAISVNLQTGAATNTGGFSNIESLKGGLASDTLTGANTANTWNLTGNNAGNVNGTFSFTAVENLTGGTNTDSFVFGDGFGVSGTINGAAGTDTLDYTAYTTVVTVNLQTSSATGTAGFSNLEAMKGGSASDTLVGANSVNAWNITGTNAGNINGTFAFMSVENLTGGSNTDNFVLSDASGVSGTVAGSGGVDTLDYTAYTTAVTVNLQTSTATGTGGFNSIESLTGGAASDTLVGANVANTWNITGNNAGNVNGSFTFSSVENLTGGTSTDSFVFGNGFGVTGTLNDAGGTDTLDYSAYTTAISVNLQSGAATGTGGFASIEVLKGGSASDTLTGANAANTWNLTANNAGNINSSFTYTSIENLVGGTSADNFVFGNGFGISGTINGAGGTDTLDYTAYTTAISVNLQTAAATGTGGFSSIEALVGGSASDTLTGADTANTWNLTGTNAGDINGAFAYTAVENLVGGTAADRFVFGTSGSVTGQVNGAGGSDTLDYSPRATAVVVNFITGTAASTGGISNIENFTGGSANDFVSAQPLAVPRAIDGGPHGTNPPGDTLFIDAQGLSVTLTPTSVTITGFAAINYANIETLDIPNTTGGGIVNGGPGDDTLDATPLTVSTIRVVLDGGPVTTLTGLDGLTFNGNDGNDLFRVTYAVGNVLLTNGITYNGNGQTGTPGDTLVIEGDTFNSGSYTPSAVSSGAGVISVDGRAITFTGLEPVTVSAMSAFTYLAPTGDNTLTVDSPAAARNRISGGNGVVTFEAVTFFDVPNFTVDTITNGGSGADTLTLAAALVASNLATFRVNTGAGNDTLRLAATAYASAGIVFAFDAGTGAGDTLQAADTANGWNITGTGSGTLTAIGSLLFTGVENFTGGSGDDAFVFSNGAGTTGTINGGAGSDTLNYGAYTTAVTLNLQTNSLTSAVGTTTVLNIEELVGGAANDSLTGPNAANTWSLTGADRGQIVNLGFQFRGVENLTGGTSTDAFQFGAGSSLSGTLNGAAGTDTLDYTNYGAAAVVNLQTSTATATGGFASIEALIGSAVSDTLVGANVANTWNLTGNNAGNVNGTFTFSAVENFTGGSAADSFVFSNGFGVTGTVNGAGGSDTLDFSAYTTAVSVNLQTGAATSTGGFANIEVLTGGSASDTLTGANSANTWNITDNNAGNVNGTFTFSAVENLTGGSSTDDFVFADAVGVTGTINGALGSDSLNYSAYTTAVSVSLQSGAATGTGGFASIESLRGGSASDTLTGANAVNAWNLTANDAGNVNGTFAFTSIENLTGGSGTDDFVFSNGVAISGTINGAGSTDTLDYTAYATAVAVNLQTGSATGTGGFSNIEALKGGGAADTLTGANMANSWSLTANNAGSINDTFAFSSIENLTGGSSTDNFVFANGVGVTGTINGAGGTDTLDYSAYKSAVTVNLQTGAATGTGGFSNIEALKGGSIADTLTGANMVNTWSLTGTNAGNVNGTFAFSNVENLVGGTSTDDFVFSDGFGVTGTINGAGGSDTLDYSAYTTSVSVNLQTGAATSTGGFSSIEALVGGAASDTLTGANGANNWNLTGTNAGNVNGTFTFSSVENLTGGTSTDAFVFSDGAGVSGTINGDGGADSLDYTAYTTVVSVNLQTGAATGTGGFASIEALLGGTASDTLTGANRANTWNLTGSNAGNINGTFTFVNIENLTGGTSTDAFVFADGVGVSGTVNGAGGSDTLDYTAYTTAVSINLQTSAATGTGGFSSIEALLGGTASDTLIGANTANTWNVTANNAGNVNGTFAFSGVENLTGGSAADRFVFGNGFGVSGAINGSGGTDTLDYSPYTTTVAVNLQTSAATNLGGFSSIETLIGGAVADTLTGANTANTWNLTGTNAGNVNGTFSFTSVENLSGGTSTDNFVFSNGAGVSGTLSGDGGTDTLDYTAYTTAVSVNLQTSAATSTGGFSNIEALIGGAASDTLTGANAANTWNVSGNNAGNVNGTFAFTSVENLTGGTAADRFAFADSAGVSGIVNGSAGSDTLDYSAYTTAVSVNLQTGAATGTGGFSSIETLLGGTASDTLTGANTANTWNLAGTNAGNVNSSFTFTSIENLTGGTNTDNFVFSNGASVSGTVNGDSGTDTLDYSAYTTAVAVNLQTGAATGTGGFSSIEALLGGTASDTLIGANTANTWNLTGADSGNVNGTFSFMNIENLTGGTSADSFVFSNGAGVTGVLSGAAGSDTLDYTAYTSAIVVDLQTGAATGTGGFSNMETLLGGFASDTLVGANTANTWNLTGTNAGNINGTFAFAAVENLTGGTSADNFVFSDGASVSGTLNGDGGTDTFDYTAYTTAISVNLQTAAATGTGGFSSIEALLGGAASDTLTGTDAANTWNLTGTNTGNVNGTFAFTNIENLTGGSGSDDFVFSAGAGVSGAINGAGGTDVLDYTAYTTAVAVNLQTGTATGTGGFSSIEALLGGTASDTLTGANRANTWNLTGSNAGNINGTFTFVNIENLTGGTSTDAFVFADGVGVSGTVNGAGGSDTLDYTAYTTAVSINLQTSAATGTGGFSSIEALVGGSASDTLTGANAANTWNLTGTNAGNINGAFTYSGVENLTGGTAADSFLITFGGSVTGLVNGAGGADTIAVTGGANDDSLAVDLQTAVLGGLAGGATVAYANIETLAFNGASQVGTDSLSLRGTAGNDAFVYTPQLPGGTSTLTGFDTAGGNAVTLVNFTGIETSGPAFQLLGNGGTDTLFVNTQGDPVTITFNKITVGARVPVTFSGIAGSALSGPLPGLSITHDDAGGTTTITSGATADAGTVSVQGGTAVGFSGLAAGAPITVTGGAGDDVLAFVNAGMALLNAAITFTGAGQVAGDRLSLSGNGNVVLNEINAAAGPGAGTLAVNNGGATILSLAYSGLEPMDDTMAATNYTFVATVASETINLDDGPVVGFTQTTRISGATFESVNFGNKTNVTVEGEGGLDTFNLNAQIQADGLASLRLDGHNVTNAGDDNAPDTFNINSTVLGVAYTAAGGGGADAFNLTPVDQFLDFLDGDLNVLAQLGGGDTLTFNDQFDSNDDTWTVTNLTVTRSFSAVVSYDNNLESIVINGGQGGATSTTYNIPSTLMDTPVTINAGAGNDAFNLGAGNFDSMAGAVILHGNGGNDSVVLNDQAAPFDDAYTITATTFTRFLFGGLTYDGIETLTLNGESGSNRIDIQSTSATTIVNAGAGNDSFTVNAAALAAGLTATLNGEGDDDTFVVTSALVGATLNLNAGDGTDTLTAPDLVNTWNLAGTGGGNVAGVVSSFSNVENLVGGALDDSFAFANAASVAGTIDGAGGNDTLDYAAYSTSVAVNLGSNAAGGAFTASLDGTQENPPTTSTATGTAALTYNSTTKTFNISVAVSGLAPNLVTGYHIHSAPVGVNGSIIINFTNLFGLGALLPDGAGGFTFNATNVALPVLQEAALLGGITYVNFHTAQFPGGAIRGQVFAANAFVAAAGTATGTAGISNVENATGGSAADSLVGNLNVNVLRGNAGNDTLLGSGGNDTVDGGANDDILAVNDGDGTDTLDGGAGSDTVQVNGNVAAGDNILVSANAGRFVVQRTNLMPFILDVGTTEQLTVAGVGGDDMLTAGNLAGTGLTGVGLHGMAGNDTFNVTASTGVTFTVSGGNPALPVMPGDVLNYNSQGAAVTLTAADITPVGFPITTYTGVETLNLSNLGSPTTLTGTSGNDVLDVTPLDSMSLRYVLNRGPAVTLAGLTALTYNAGAGNDSTSFNFSAGGVLLMNGVTINGGTQTAAPGDSLVVVGSAFNSARYQPDAVTSGTGKLLVDSLGIGTRTITFTGVEPVTVSQMTALTLEGAAGNNVLTVDMDPATPGRNRVTGGNGVTAYSPLDFYGVTNFTLDTATSGAGGNDTVTLAAPGLVAAGLASFAVKTGGGSDSLIVDALTYTTPGQTFTFDGGANSDTLRAANVANFWTLTGANAGTLGSAGSIAFSNVETLTGNAQPDMFVVQDSARVDGRIDGANGIDTLNYALYTAAVTVNLQTSTATGTGGFGSIEELIGGLASDTLIGTNTVNAWQITSNNAGEVNGFRFLSSVENLTGGTQADRFIFANGVSVSGTIDGGLQGASEQDTLDYSAYTTAVSVNLQTGTATGTGRFAGIERLLGGAASDTLTGANTVNTWNLTDNNTGNINGTFLFSSVENLNGGSDSDSFVFGNGFGVSGAINGGSGGDTLNYSAYTVPVVVNLQALTATSLARFSSIETFVGGMASDTLVGPEGPTTWTLTGTNAGNVNGATATYTNFENLTSGSGVNRFVFQTGATVGGRIDGTAGNDTLDYSALPGPITVTMRASGTNLASNIGIGFVRVEAVVGSAAAGATSADTLVGADTANTWNLTGTNTGTLNVGTTNGISFSGIENLTGGSQADAFVFGGGTRVDGTLDGGLGTDTLDYTAYTSTVTVNLQTRAATGTGGFNNIEALVGGTRNDDVLAGPNTANTWNLTGTNAGTVGTFAFSRVENLAGGTDADTFFFRTGGGVTGTLTGGTGNNTLDYSALTTPVTINLQTGSATATGGIDGFNTLIGGVTNDTLLGANTSNTWNLTGTNAGTLNGTATTFASFENLTGGTSTDEFIINDNTSVTGRIDGNAGSDTLNYSAFTTTVTVNLGAGTATATGGIANLETLRGGTTATDVLVGPNTANTWNLTGTNAGSLNGTAYSNFENLTGGTADDSFVFQGGTVSGRIKGGTGLDTLNFAATTTSRVVILSGFVADGFSGRVNSATDNFDGIDQVIGSGAADDSLHGLNAAALWQLATANQYQDQLSGRSLVFSLFETLEGDNAADTFSIVSQGVVRTLLGNGGDDNLTVTANGVTAPLTFTGGAGRNSATILDSAETANTTATLTSTGISGTNLFGSGGSFAYSGLSSLALYLGTGNDLINVSSKDAATTVNVLANDGNDTFNVMVNSSSGYANLSLDGGAPAGGISLSGTGDVLNVMDPLGVASGAVIHNNLTTGASSGLVDVTYPAGMASRVAYQNMESVTTNPTAVESFVQALYRNVLGRTGGAAEIAGWVATYNATAGVNPNTAQLAAARMAVVNGIEGSLEARLQVVRGWYTQFLGRSADGDSGAVGWATQLGSLSEENVLKQILGSQEFLTRAQAMFPASTAGESYIRALYQLLLNRTVTANDPGLAYWLSVLPTKGRTGVALDFLQSVEYRFLVVRGYYTTLLRRSQAPSDGEVAFWVFSSLDLRTIRRNIEASQEYFDRGF